MKNRTAIIIIILGILAGWYVLTRNVNPPAPEPTEHITATSTDVTTATTSPEAPKPTVTPKPTLKPTPVVTPKPTETPVEYTDIELASVADPRVSEIIGLVNAERAKVGLEPLVESGRLDKAAQAKTDDEVAKQYFSHESPDGNGNYTVLIADAGYPYSYAGENLAVKYDNFEQAVEAWINSPTHRANILKPAYKETGIGISIGDYTYTDEDGKTHTVHDVTYIAQYFGAR